MAGRGLLIPALADDDNDNDDDDDDISIVDDQI